MQNPPHRAPIPAFAQDVLALFREELADVQFPTVDRAALEASAKLVESAQVEVERIEQQLEEARARVAAQAEELTVLAQRALAYARVYAECEEGVAARVERIAQHQSPSPTSHGKKRGRSRKSAEPEEGLFQQVTESPALGASLLDS